MQYLSQQWYKTKMNTLCLTEQKRKLYHLENSIDEGKFKCNSRAVELQFRVSPERKKRVIANAKALFRNRLRFEPSSCRNFTDRAPLSVRLFKLNGTRSRVYRERQREREREREEEEGGRPWKLAWDRKASNQNDQARFQETVAGQWTFIS